MPTYEYRCPHGHEFDLFRKMSEAEPTWPCPVCAAPAERRISAGAGLLFKGSGFYITDYGKDGKKDQRAAPKGSGGGDRGAGGAGEEKGKKGDGEGTGDGGGPEAGGGRDSVKKEAGQTGASGGGEGGATGGAGGGAASGSGGSGALKGKSSGSAGPTHSE